jgi:hypothetical protein
MNSFTKEAAMDMDRKLAGSAEAPTAFIRLALVTTDLAAVPLLACAFTALLAFALASLGIAAGGVNFVLGLRFLDYFPRFPAAARILSGLSLLAFAALLLACTLLLWHLFRAAWHRFWSWHRSAWQGTWVRLASISAAAGHAERTRAYMRPVTLSGLIFLALLAVAFGLMLLLARGPFWHAWGWFA